MAVAPSAAEYEYFLDDDAGAPRTAGHWTDLVTLVDGQLARTVTRYSNTGGVELKRTVIADRASAARAVCGSGNTPPVADTASEDLADVPEHRRRLRGRQLPWDVGGTMPFRRM